MWLWFDTVHCVSNPQHPGKFALASKVVEDDCSLHWPTLHAEGLVLL